MDMDKFEKYLKNRYFYEIEWYDSKSLWNQKLYKIFQWSLIIFSSITPIFIIQGFILSDYFIAKIIPIITSIFVAIMTAALKTFKFQENWVNYRTTCETLKKEIYFYEANVDQYAHAKDKEALFIERVESLISRENTLWLSVQKQKKNE